MSDINDRLANLHHNLDKSAPSAPIGDDVVAADVHRGERALRNRNLRRGAIGAGGVAAVAAVVSFALVGTSTPSANQRIAERGGPLITASSTVTSRPAQQGSGNTRTTQRNQTGQGTRNTTIELVAYHGEQRPGFTVESVPDGYVLQGVKGSVLDIAKAGDQSDLDDFRGKLTVGIEENSDGQGLDAYDGAPVTINGHPGVVSAGSGDVTVVFEQGGGSNNVVIVQSLIDLTKQQVIDFAQGVTVTADAVRSHG